MIQQFKRRLGFSAFTAFALVSCNFSDDRSDSARAIYSAFSSSCASVGPWTAAASSQTTALKDLFLYMQNSDPCKAVAGELSGLASATQSLNTLLSDSQFLSVKSAEEQINQIHLALADVTGTDDASKALKATLSQSLVSAQLSLYESRAQYDAWKTPVEGGASATAMKALHTQLSSIVSASKGPLAECLRQSPLAQAQLGISTVALGGSFVSPALGAATQLAALMVNTALETARKARYADQLWKVYQAEMPMSLSCALESMTQLYCAIDDTEALLDVIASIPPNPGLGREPTLSPNPALRAIELLNRQLPSLGRWLEILRAGGTANDPYDAARRNDAWRKLVQLEIDKNTFEGRVRDFETRAGFADDPKILFRDLVFSIATGSGVYSGLATSVYQMGCMLIEGYEYGPKCPTEVPPQSDLDQGFDYAYKRWLDKHFAEKVGKFELVYEGLKSLHVKATEQISREFARVIIRKPLAIVTGAFTGTDSELSPERVLEEIRDYLSLIERDLSLYRNPQFEAQLKSLKARIERAIAVLLTPLPPGLPEKEKETQALAKVIELGALFSVSEGSRSLIDELRQVFRIDLQVRVQLPEEQGGLPKDVAEILLTSALEMDTRLTQVTPGRDQVALQLDASRGKQKTEANLKIFRESFAPYFERAATQLKSAAQGEPSSGLRDRPNSQILAHFCLQILATHQGEYPSPKIATACTGARLESPYFKSNPGLSVDLDQARPSIRAAKKTAQFCWYHREFVRRNRLSRVIPVLPPIKGIRQTLTRFSSELGLEFGGETPWGDRLFPER